jgi:hypothetical protein
MLPEQIEIQEALSDMIHMHPERVSTLRMLELQRILEHAGLFEDANTAWKLADMTLEWDG